MILDLTDQKLTVDAEGFEAGNVGVMIRAVERNDVSVAEEHKLAAMVVEELREDTLEEPVLGAQVAHVDIDARAERFAQLSCSARVE
jgi:hypothetical protein